MYSSPITALQFKLFRFIFGIYLLWHFISLIPYREELFGPGKGEQVRNSMIPDPSMNPGWTGWTRFWPDFLIPTTNIAIAELLNIMVMSSIFFALGFLQNLNSLILWYGWAFLFNRNNLISNPGLPYVGWLLLACTIISSPGSLLQMNPIRLIDADIQREWKMHPLIYWSAWLLMALGYTISGAHKLQCQSWLNGSALYHVLNNVLARDNFLVSSILAIMRLSPLTMKLMTWSSLFLEISFLPLGLFDRLRLPYWIAFICMHIGILFTINFTDLTLGVMMIHLFTFDGRWLGLGLYSRDNWEIKDSNPTLSEGNQYEPDKIKKTPDDEHTSELPKLPKLPELPELPKLPREIKNHDDDDDVDDKISENSSYSEVD